MSKVYTSTLIDSMSKIYTYLLCDVVILNVYRASLCNIIIGFDVFRVILFAIKVMDMAGRYNFIN